MQVEEVNVFIDKLIELAIAEDIGDGDHSSLACIPPHERGTAQLMMKQEGIVAGVALAERIYRRLDPTATVQLLIADGTQVGYGDIVFRVEATVHTLLQAERIVLNIMQRMSGIATQTNAYVQRCAGTKARVLDTRKTTPGMRVLDKMAVAIGGGMNHRMGLFDMIMLKDNHIDFAGGVGLPFVAPSTIWRRRGVRFPSRWKPARWTMCRPCYAWAVCSASCSTTLA